MTCHFAFVSEIEIPTPYIPLSFQAERTGDFLCEMFMLTLSGTVRLFWFVQVGGRETITVRTCVFAGADAKF